MLISSRGRYALRALADLAENGQDKLVSISDISARQGISKKYLEQILPVLTKNRLIEGFQGKGGGYRLTKDVKDYSVGEILRLVEGSTAAVSCVENGGELCEKADKCKTHDMWVKLNALISDYLDGVSLADIISGNV